MKKIILSIGAYTAEEVERLAKNRNIIFYLYDPRPEVFFQFKSGRFDKNKNIHFHCQAISISNAIRFLSDEGTASRLINKEGKDANTKYIEVESITLREAVKNIFVEQSKPFDLELMMNCEGEEVLIVLSTEDWILTLFNKINIEFHPQHCSNITIEATIYKLAKYFKYTKFSTSKTKSPVYTFERK